MYRLTAATTRTTTIPYRKRTTKQHFGPKDALQLQRPRIMVPKFGRPGIVAIRKPNDIIVGTPLQANIGTDRVAIKRFDGMQIVFVGAIKGNEEFEDTREEGGNDALEGAARRSVVLVVVVQHGTILLLHLGTFHVGVDRTYGDN